MVGMEIGHYQMICRRFRGAVGASGRVGGLFIEGRVFRPKMAIDFVGRDVMESFPAVLFGRFQKRVRADNIRVDKRGAVEDGAVHVGFGGEIHDNINIFHEIIH